MPHLLFLSVLAFHHLYVCRALLTKQFANYLLQSEIHSNLQKYTFSFAHFFLLLPQNTFNQKK